MARGHDCSRSGATTHSSQGWTRTPPRALPGPVLWMPSSLVRRTLIQLSHCRCPLPATAGRAGVGVGELGEPPLEEEFGRASHLRHPARELVGDRPGIGFVASDSSRDVVELPASRARADAAPRPGASPAESPGTRCASPLGLARRALAACSLEERPAAASMAWASSWIPAGRHSLASMATVVTIGGSHWAGALSLGRSVRGMSAARASARRSAHRAICAFTVRLVDVEEDVRDLEEDAGLDGLDVVAHARHDHHRHAVRQAGDVDLVLADAHRLDDHQVLAHGVHDPNGCRRLPERDRQGDHGSPASG